MMKRTMAMGRALIAGGASLLAPVAQAAFYYVNNGHPLASDTNPGTLAAPLKTIQAAAERARAGDTVVVKAGTYREAIMWRHPGRPEARSTLMAASGETVVVKGSLVVTGWERCGAREAGLSADFPGANIWVKRGWERQRIEPPEWASLPHYYRPRYDDIRQAFYRDAVLEGAGRLTAAFLPHEFEEGRLLADTSGRRLFIWLPPGINPNMQGVEVSVLPSLFSGTYGPGVTNDSLDYVTVRGLQFRHAVERAVTTMDGTETAIEDCVVTWNYRSAIYVRGRRSRIVRNVFGFSGSGGLTGAGEGHLFEDNLVLANNLDNHVYFNNSGGGKLTNLNKCTFRRHRAIRNNGCGLWLDCECNDNVFEDCDFSFNAGVGLDIEISRRNLVRNCIFAYNVPRPSGYAISHASKHANQRTYDAGGGGWGLTSRNSDGTHVYHCLFYGNTEGGLLLGSGPRVWKEKDPQTGAEIVKSVGGRDLVAVNNIFANNGRWQLNMATPTKDPDAASCRSDYNLFWGPNPVSGFGTLEQWTKESGFDQHSLMERPDVPFGLDGNFELPATSPAVDAGLAVAQCQTDRRGVPRPVGNAVDLGPFERVSTLGVAHRPVIPEGLTFQTLDFANLELLDWKPELGPALVPLAAWPAGKTNQSLAAFADALPRTTTGTPTSGCVTLSGVPFHLRYPDTVLALPERHGYVRISVARKADWFFFLHAAAGAVKGKPGAYYRVTYADGDMLNLSFVADQNYANYLAADPEAFFARERGANSAVAWRGATTDGRAVTILRLAWPNHRPDVEVTDIQIWRQPNSAEWAVLGITLGKR